MKRLFNFLFIPMESFVVQDKNPFLVSFLTLVFGLLGYHRLYMKQTIRWVLACGLTFATIFAWSNWGDGRFFLIWLAYLILQAVVYLIMGFAKPSKVLDLDLETSPVQRPASPPPVIEREEASDPADITVQAYPLDKSLDNKKTQASSEFQVKTPPAPLQVNARNFSGDGEIVVAPELERTGKARRDNSVKRATEGSGKDGSQPLHFQRTSWDSESLDPKALDRDARHMQAIEAITQPDNPLWQHDQVKESILTHFTQVLDSMEPSLKALSQEDLSSYSHLRDYYTKGLVTQPMKDLLQAVLTLSEGLVLAPYMAAPGSIQIDAQLDQVKNHLPQEAFQAVDQYVSDQIQEESTR